MSCRGKERVWGTTGASARWPSCSGWAQLWSPRRRGQWRNLRIPGRRRTPHLRTGPASRFRTPPTTPVRRVQTSVPRSPNGSNSASAEEDSTAATGASSSEDPSTPAAPGTGAAQSTEVADTASAGSDGAEDPESEPTPEPIGTDSGSEAATAPVDRVDTPETVRYRRPRRSHHRNVIATSSSRRVSSSDSTPPTPQAQPSAASTVGSVTVEPALSSASKPSHRLPCRDRARIVAHRAGDHRVGDHPNRDAHPGQPAVRAARDHRRYRFHPAQLGKPWARRWPAVRNHRFRYRCCGEWWRGCAARSNS